MKQKRLSILLLNMLLGMFVTTASAHDIEVPNADGVMIYYVWQNDGTELAVSFEGEIGVMSKNKYAGDVVIPESVVYEGNTYPVTGIASSAFSECPALTSVTVPNGVTNIGNSAFYGCTGLTSVTLPNSVTTIGSFAFFACYALTSVTIPDSVTTIEEFTFDECVRLTSVTLGRSVESVETFAFAGCNNLKSLTFHCPVVNGEWFPQQVKEVVIGSEVQSFVERSFGGYGGLANVYLLQEQPYEIDVQVFSRDTYDLGTLHVPVGTKELYKQTAGWNRFVNIEEGAPTGINAAHRIKGAEEAVRYTLDGRQLSKPQQGVNIVRMTDGTTKKVMVR